MESILWHICFNNFQNTTTIFYQNSNVFFWIIELHLSTLKKKTPRRYHPCSFRHPLRSNKDQCRSGANWSNSNLPLEIRNMWHFQLAWHTARHDIVRPSYDVSLQMAAADLVKWNVHASKNVTQWNHILSCLLISRDDTACSFGCTITFTSINLYSFTKKKQIDLMTDLVQRPTRGISVWCTWSPCNWKLA